MSKEEDIYNYTPLPEPIPITEQEWPDDVLPLVSIRTMAYNHEKFIRECIEGVLIQKTTFPVQFLIHDDASTDNTASIIKEYEEKYPRLIKAYYQTENSYSKSSEEKGRLRKTFFQWITGKYVALCEGDDYWTDPLKLQKQVSFLEENPEFVLACGGYKSMNVYTKEEKVIIKEAKKSKKREDGFEFGLEEMKKQWLTKTLTVVHRTNALKYYPVKQYKYSRDVHLFYHLIKIGKGFYFSSMLGSYRIHEGGVSSMIDKIKKNKSSYLIYKELFERNHDDFTRTRYLIKISILLNSLLFSKNEKIASYVNFKKFTTMLKLVRKWEDIKWVTRTFVPDELIKKLSVYFK